MTRQKAERLCREVIASHAGEPLADNLFKESVDMLMAEAAKTELKENKPIKAK